MKQYFKYLLLLTLLILSPLNESYSQIGYGNKILPISAVAPGTDSFKVEITTIGASESFTFPFWNGGSYNGTINFGDGGGDFDITTYDHADATNIYTVAGTYEITISGIIGGINVNSQLPDLRFDDITQWGIINWGYLNFHDCSNMVITATDVPDLSGITSFTSLFRGCSSITTIPNVNSWDVSTITDLLFTFASCTSLNIDISDWTCTPTTMQSTFQGCYLFNSALTNINTSSCTTMRQAFLDARVFNQSLNGFDTGLVTDFYQCFYKAWAFNGNITSWDTGSATNMEAMFRDAFVFNQDIANWDVSGVLRFHSMFRSTNSFNQAIGGVGKWDTSGSNSMEQMFYDADGFNSAVDNFDVSGVTTFRNMFALTATFNQSVSSWVTSSAVSFRTMFQSSSAFDQDISGFDVTGVTDLTAMLSGSSFSKTNYDLLLPAWDAQVLVSGRSFSAGPAQYTSGNVDTGTTDGTTANKLVDSTQNFLTTVSVGDVVHSITTSTEYAIVTYVDSNTVLSLSVDIMTSGEVYDIESSSIAKNKENMVNSDGWLIGDGGGG